MSAAPQCEVKCVACGFTAWPQVTLNAAGKLKPACPQCGQEHPDTEPEAVVSTKTLRLVPEVSVPERMDVFSIVRERLAHLETEDARLEGVKADTAARLIGLRAEAKKLRKMLAAADRAGNS